MGVDPILWNCVGSRSYELKTNLDKTTETDLICPLPLTTGLNLLHGAKFQRFLKVFFWTQIFKSENFMHIEWSEEKFLKGSVGRQMKLCFWNKLQITDLLLMQLASNRNVLTRKFKYQLELYVLIDFIY